MAQGNSEGIPFIWRGALAAVGATVVTFAVWAATDLVFGGAAIIGLLFGVVGLIFGALAGGEPVYTYHGDGRSVPGARPLPGTIPTKPAPAPTEAADPAPAPEPVAEAPAAEKTVGSSDIVKPSAPLPGEAELAEKKGDWKYEGGEEKAEPAPDADAPEGTKPEMLDAARDGGADNLKEIKGVGPKLEQLLNSLGVYHFDQISGWTADEVAWVDQNLEGFKGRVTRDDWVEQAKILAAGGETEFSKKVDKGGVY